MKVKGKRTFLLIFLGVGFFFLAFYYQAILIGAGRFLAPEGVGKAEVVIMEGTELIREKAIDSGKRILSTGRAGRLVLVYQKSEDEKIFGRPLDYNLFLGQKLEELGLRKDQIQILEVPKKHPITLFEAKYVLSNLSKNGIRNAILLSEDFHTRRSYWTYKQVGIPLGIEIIPYPCFITYRDDTWWQQVNGIRNFIGESMKFFYYLLLGYIPLRSLISV